MRLSAIGTAFLVFAMLAAAAAILYSRALPPAVARLTAAGYRLESLHPAPSTRARGVVAPFARDD